MGFRGGQYPEDSSSWPHVQGQMQGNVQQPGNQQWPPPQWQPPGQPPTRPSAQWGPPPGQPPLIAPPGRRKPPRKGSTGRTIAIIAGAAVVVFILVATLSHGSSPAPSPAASGAPAGTTAPAAQASTAAAAAAGSTVTYVVSGAPADVTYGPAGSDLSGSVPMSKTAKIPSSAPAYYSIDAQLNGSGTVSCKIEVNGKVVSQATATGSYNIASCEITQDPFSGAWQDANAG